MNITVIGTGYVGLVSGACLADLGNNVICLDTDKEKIDSLNKGIIPIYEPLLKDIIDRSRKEGRLVFTTDTRQAIEKSEVLFICVGTPSDKEGKVDLSSVKQVATSIGTYMKGYKVIVTKSTVPIGTGDKIAALITKHQKKKIAFDMVSAPEFLREGQAIRDFMGPDRIVIGVESPKARVVMESLFKGLERTNQPILFTDVKSAEMIKYASNAMLACRISFMNQLSLLCEKTGADIKVVAKGMGLDDRIGIRFLQAGVGYGGSCFPKDVQALTHLLKDYGCPADLIESIHLVNERQKLRMVDIITETFGKAHLKGKTLCIWGLAFKPKTDDIRNAPSITIIRELLHLGVKIKTFDPIAQDHMKAVFPTIQYTENPYEAAEAAHGIVLVTEWDSFRTLDWQRIKKSMKDHYLFDGRNIFNPWDMVQMGFKYRGIGRGKENSGHKKGA